MTGQASPLRSNELLSLAENQFYPLREAEEKLLRAAPAGETAWCGPTQQGFDSANDPRKADTWGPQRSIRAELLRWLCVEREAKVERRLDRLQD